MKKQNYLIRTMTEKEVAFAIEWAATEGWNPGRHDAACYFTADPNGFYIGLLDGEPIATISAIKYGQTFGFVGFYLVKPEYRGQGYGIRIWNAGLNSLEGRIIGLDGVVAQQENYQKSGFTLAYRHIRYQGYGGGKPCNKPEIVQLSTLSFTTIECYDQQFFPEKRSEFLKMWIHQPDCHALGIMQNGRLSGYGVIRPCRYGYKIGPLYAESSELAEALFQTLRSRVDPSASVFLDVPEANPSAVKLAERHRMRVVFETARMYAGKQPAIPVDRVFGVTSFEVG